MQLGRVFDQPRREGSRRVARKRLHLLVSLGVRELRDQPAVALGQHLVLDREVQPDELGLAEMGDGLDIEIARDARCGSA
jgi:hypothetical protein